MGTTKEGSRAVGVCLQLFTLGRHHLGNLDLKTDGLASKQHLSERDQMIPLTKLVRMLRN